MTLTSHSVHPSLLLEPAQVFPAGAVTPTVQLLDVRAPVEVARCGFPGTRTLPILNDEERARVGTCYREHGQEAAIALGIALTAPHKQQRIAGWKEAIAASDGRAALACWRGGQRSRIAQQWLADPAVPRVAGGTKALRQFLMVQLELRFAASDAVVISGLTGCGKTDVLHALAKRTPEDVLALDLEGLANHRGSAFGGFPEGQPSQQTFENHLAATVQLAAPRRILLEDEARNVGRLELPLYVWAKTKQAPVVMVVATQQQRVERIAREYVFAPTSVSNRADVRENLTANLNKLAKRLGGVRLRECLEALEYADHEDRWFTAAAHQPWIDTLLLHYYDKFYESAMTRLNREILFTGTAEEVLQWFATSGFRA